MDETALVSKVSLSQEPLAVFRNISKVEVTYNKLHLFRVHDLIHLTEVLSQGSPEINCPHKKSLPAVHSPPCRLEKEIDHIPLSKLASGTT